MKNLLGNVHCAFERRAWQDHTEFITTAPEDKVCITNRLRESTCDLSDHLIANDVPKCVVYDFEGIDIDHQQR